jgi:hypothetical protein
MPIEVSVEQCTLTPLLLLLVALSTPLAASSSEACVATKAEAMTTQVWYGLSELTGAGFTYDRNSNESMVPLYRPDTMTWVKNVLLAKV